MAQRPLSLAADPCLNLRFLQPDPRIFSFWSGFSDYVAIKRSGNPFGRGPSSAIYENSELFLSLLFVF